MNIHLMTAGFRNSHGYSDSNAYFYKYGRYQTRLRNSITDAHWTAERGFRKFKCHRSKSSRQLFFSMNSTSSGVLGNPFDIL